MIPRRERCGLRPDRRRHSWGGRSCRHLVGQQRVVARHHRIQSGHGVRHEESPVWMCRDEETVAGLSRVRPTPWTSHPST